MTRSIIGKHLLISGSPALPDIHKLEREANSHGFSIERSAKFGIGVLSYFMLADRMVVITRRSDLAGGDPDNTGWRFDTEGLGGFGQLTKVARNAPGTHVRLRIRAEFADDMNTFKEQLLSYTKKMLTFLPCRFEIALSNRKRVRFNRAWCRETRDFEDLVLQSFTGETRYDDGSLLPTDEIKRRQQEDDRWATIRSSGRESMHFEQAEGELPDAGAKYRIHLCYFDLDGGASLGFLDISGSQGRNIIGSAHTIIPSCHILHSSSGFSAKAFRLRAHLDKTWRSLHRLPLIIEIDWIRMAIIGINRERLTIDEHVIQHLMSVLYEESVALLKSFLVKNGSSSFAALNRAWVARCFNEEETPVPGNFRAIIAEHNLDTQKFTWGDVHFPAVELHQSMPIGKALKWRGAPLQCFLPLEMPGRRQYLSTFLGTKCDRILLAPYDCIGIRELFRVLPLWERCPRWVEDREVSNLATFPEEWRSVCLVASEQRWLWNEGNPLVSITKYDDWIWALKQDRSRVSEYAGEMLAAPSRACAWAMYTMGAESSVGYWTAIQDQLPDFFMSLLDLMSEIRKDVGCGENLYCLVYDERFRGSFEVKGLSKQGLQVVSVPELNWQDNRLMGRKRMILELPADPDWWAQRAE